MLWMNKGVVKEPYWDWVQFWCRFLTHRPPSISEWVSDPKWPLFGYEPHPMALWQNETAKNWLALRILLLFFFSANWLYFVVSEDKKKEIIHKLMPLLSLQGLIQYVGRTKHFHLLCIAVVHCLHRYSFNKFGLVCFISLSGNKLTTIRNKCETDSTELPTSVGVSELQLHLFLYGHFWECLFSR